MKFACDPFQATSELLGNCLESRKLSLTHAVQPVAPYIPCETKTVSRCICSHALVNHVINKADATCSNWDQPQTGRALLYLSVRS